MSNTFFEKLQGKYLPTLSRVNYSCVETILGFSDCMSFSFRIHTGSTEHKHMHGNERAGHKNVFSFYPIAPDLLVFIPRRKNLHVRNTNGEQRNLKF